MYTYIYIYIYIYLYIYIIYTLNIYIYVLQHLNVNQWKNSTSFIKWFSELDNKNDCIFIKFDIREFYPSISEDILKTSLYLQKNTKIYQKKIIA